MEERRRRHVNLKLKMESKICPAFEKRDEEHGVPICHIENLIRHGYRCY